MSRRRGRPRKDVRVRVHAQRREHIDFGALARAVLEQAAIDQKAERERDTAPTPSEPRPLGTPTTDIAEKGDADDHEVA